MATYDFTIQGTINDVEDEEEARKELQHRLRNGSEPFGDLVYFDTSTNGSMTFERVDP